MGFLERATLVTGLGLLAACSAITSFDNFVGAVSVDPDAAPPTGTSGGTTTGTSGSPGTSGSAGTSGNPVDTDSGLTDSGTSGDPKDAATKDPICRTSTPKTGSSAVVVGGGRMFSNPINVIASDDTPATVDLVATTGDESQTISITNFNIPDIPTNATLRGIRAIVRLRSNADDVRTNEVRIQYDGAERGVPKDDIEIANGTTYYDQIIGGPTDSWGASGLAAEKFKSPNFGLAYRVKHHGTGLARVEVDFIRLEVTYCYPDPN